MKANEVTLSIFHLDISGNDDIELQLKKIPVISLISLGFHLEISGNDNKE